MNDMGFNVIKGAKDDTKAKDKLGLFLKQKGISLEDVERDPKYYEDLIMDYSRKCINDELFKQSKEHMEEEFNRLCEFHRRNQEALVKQFFNIVNDFITQNKESI